MNVGYGCGWESTSPDNLELDGTGFSTIGYIGVPVDLPNKKQTPLLVVWTKKIIRHGSWLKAT